MATHAPDTAGMRRARILLLAVFCGAARVDSATLEAAVSDGTGKPVENAIVYLESKGASARPISAEKLAVIDQINKEFVPRVVAVVAGSAVTFPNRDDIRHHVYSFSEARKFELPLYEGTPAEPVVFDKPGVVTLGCNIHDWMRGYILVLDTPDFAATDRNGSARLEGLAAGRYRVMVWHPDLRQGGAVEGESLQLEEAAEASAVFRVDLKPALRIRRAPTSRRDDRY